MKTLLLVGIFSLTLCALVVHATRSTRNCDIEKNEEYCDCINPCNTCEERGECSDTREEDDCEQGCDCIKNHYRNSTGHCVPEDRCDEPGPGPGPGPNPDSCPFNEERRVCSCEKTCCGKGLDEEQCANQCLTGCFCREGLVRDEYGNCIEREDCGKIEPPGNCREDQQYYRNKPDCKNNCQNYNNPAILCAVGKPGCFCKEGLVLRKDGKCVPPEECPQESTCGENEEQTDCAKPVWCNTCEIRGNCKLKRCTSGCDCKPGFYRDSNGRCIDQFDCPRNKTCGSNEQYTTCGSACPDTCENYGKNRVCTLQCVEGCFCKPGYVRNKRGDCILPELCQKTQKTCNKDEKYLTCGSACPARCSSSAPLPCPTICIRGCFCEDGLIRDTNLKCVRPDKCSNRNNTSGGSGSGPEQECGVNEQYNVCGSVCPPTCDKPKPGKCIQSCKAGCFCKPGFIRQSKGGPCIPETQCPGGTTPGSCGTNEEFTLCGSSCPNTCDNYGKNRICTQQCVPGCFCKPGYVRNSPGGCILPELCRKTARNCNKDETYTTCGSACPITCTLPPRPCSFICIRGCYCKRGTLRDTNLKCVKPEKCSNRNGTSGGSGPGEVCGVNEQYNSCGSNCPPTCDKPKPGLCIQSCKAGCFCKPGFIRQSKGGPCIPEKQCPSGKGPGSCGVNEQFTNCGSACPDTCDNYGKDRVCTLQCVTGCFCKPGYVRNKRGECVLPEFCQKAPRTCNRDERYLTCGSACPVTCASLVVSTDSCAILCVRGCFCKEELIRDINLKCVKPEKCSNRNDTHGGNGSGPDVKCGKNEQYKRCGTNCPPTCDRPEPGTCGKICRAGCFCRPGFIRKSAGGPCIPEKQCPAGKCKPYEEYLTCGSSCPDTCDNYGVPKICTAQCVPGCFCKKGLVRAPDGRCIIPEMCERENCNRDEEFLKCGTACPDTCDNYGIDRFCTFQCVRGCFCKRGLVRNNDFQCVIPEKCRKKKCNKDEVFKTCGTACPKTCENYDQRRACTKNCVRGCFCAGDTVRNVDNKKCVPQEKCPKKSCSKKGEVYKACGSPCEASCNSLRFRIGILCQKKCKPGCFCKDNLVRDSDGNCIPPKSCPKFPQCSIPECDEGCSIDYSSKPCPTCDCNNEPTGPQCSIPKCDEGCKIDYSTKPCPSCNCNNTPPKKCGKDEQYYDCVPSCKNTCKNYFNPGIRCACGPPGCYCKEGLVKNDNGKCVKPEKCPNSNPKKCGKDEQYYDCVPSCKNTCKAYFNPGIRCGCGPPGCYCKEGLVKNDDGKCVKPETCPNKKCYFPNEVYSSCVNPCNNCEIKGKCNFLVCNKGCDCKKGYYRDELGACIPERECPTKGGDKDKCTKPGEVYKTCGSPCEPKCQKLPYRIGIKCPKKCVAGCFCKDGLLRDSEGNCVKPSDCDNGGDKDKCTKPGEVYKTCGSPCEPKCQKTPFRIGIVCPKKCVAGCFCEEGLLRDSEGNCVEPSDCDNGGDKPKCTKPREVYKTCGPFCEPRCQYPPFRIGIVCLKKCVAGCFCEDGLLRDAKGNCVEPSDCENKKCGRNEEFQKCGTRCPPTCDNPDRICIKSCVSGCFCKKNFVRSKDGGECIPVSQCPKKGPICLLPLCREGCRIVKVDTQPCPKCVCDEPTCKKDEQYYDCLPCNSTCRSYYIPTSCTAVCTPGCDCKEGTFRRSDGKCVKPNLCPKPTPACSIPACKVGCRIVKDDSQPCPRCVCDEPTCKRDEQYYECLPCNRTCESYYIPQACAAVCTPGCHCKEGTFRNKNGKCVRPNQCPKPKCGLFEKYTTCVNPCNDCEDQGDCEFLVCNKGCDCIKGYHRESLPNGRCIPASQCPEDDNPDCPLPSCEEGCTIDYDAKPCPTCKCDKGPICFGPFCGEGCRLVKVDTQPCPKCVCDNPDCPLPSCEEGCTIDYNAKPCPTCKCDKTPIGPICPREVCRVGCRLVKDESSPCPRCVCDEPTCKNDEQYYECIPCNKTCETYNKPVGCSALCRPGCECRDGLVRRRDGRCVNPKQCPKPNCGPFEKYTTCVNPCNDCEIRGKCAFLVCNEGCDCIKGYHRKKLPNGRCIPAAQCPGNGTVPVKCGEDEEFAECVPCGNTCETYQQRKYCKPACKPGCTCKGDLVKRKDGKCVPTDQCGKGPICNIPLCKVGCKIVKDDSQPCPRCVCDEKCGENEEYSTCGGRCQKTCSNRNPICPLICIGGCVCKEGFLRNNGACVPEEECPRKDCPLPKCRAGCRLDRSHKPCPICACDDNPTECPLLKCRADCPLDRSHKPCPICVCNDNPPDCPIVDCLPGCHVDNAHKPCPRCVCDNNPPTKPTKPPKCGPEEEYYQCKPFCTNVCNPSKICPTICISGCYCKKGLVQREDGKCVAKDQCNKQPECAEDQQYYQCKPNCHVTCETYDKKDIACPDICQPGCFCKEGLVQRKDGKCVKPDQCNEQDCGPDEELYQCKPFCINRCNPLKICPRICLKGCFCRKGLVLDEDGKCVRKEECKKKDCPKIKCAPNCRTDANHKPCPRCVCDSTPTDCPQIKCAPNCRTDANHKPCPRCVCDSTPPVCPIIECAGNCRLDASHKPCPRCVCDIPTECPLINCLAGCRLDYTHKPCPRCVCDENPPPGSCGKNEVFSPCRGHCSARCDNLEPPCSKLCQPGCICKKGFAKDDQGVCIPVQQCPPKICPQIRCIEGCYLDESHKPCPKCVCKTTECPLINCLAGCRLDKTHKPCPRCVCDDNPPPGSCGKNEVFSPCSGHCSARCDDLDPVCTKQCQPGCICKKGFAKDDQGVCIPVQQCPPRNCKPDEEYYQCKPFCTNRCNPSKICPKICVKGCFCRKGLVLDVDGKCVRKEECKNKGIQCDPPKCDGPGCQLDYSTKPCPTCRCEGIQCDPPKCDGPGCQLDYSTKPCPTCRCEIDGGGIQCDTPKCDGPGCQLDYSTKPCPTCRCEIDGGGIQCGPLKCDDPGCELDYSTKPCPTCRCETDTGGTQCDTPKCDDPGCQLDYSTQPCPTCRCEIDEESGYDEGGYGEQTIRRQESGSSETTSESEQSESYSYSENDEYSYDDNQQDGGGRTSGTGYSDTEEIIGESYESDGESESSEYLEVSSGGSESSESSFTSGGGSESSGSSFTSGGGSESSGSSFTSGGGSESSGSSFTSGGGSESIGSSFTSGGSSTGWEETDSDRTERSVTEDEEVEIDSTDDEEVESSYSESGGSESRGSSFTSGGSASGWEETDSDRTERSVTEDEEVEIDSTNEEEFERSYSESDDE